MQPIDLVDGIARFRENAVVRHIVDHGASVVHRDGIHAGRLDLNKLRSLGLPDEDWEQFAQLMGYSVSGFGGLSYASSEATATADAQVETLLRGKEDRQ